MFWHISSTSFNHGKFLSALMAELKLFTKNDCPKCDYVKERLPKGVEIQIMNVDTVDGLAEGAFYEILDKTFPVLVSDDEFAAEGSINVLNKINGIVENR
jgi:glutaredoxin